jgi:tetratricopeptide (TPR) repeat protein
LQDFWDTRGYTSEGYQWTSSALKNAPDSPSLHYCRALIGTGLMSLRISRIQEGLLYLENAIARARQLNNTPLLMMSLLSSAIVMNDRAEAKKRYAECIELARATRNSWCLIEALAASPTHGVDETIRYIEEARDIADALGNARRRALVLNIYGGIETFRAHYNSATSMLEEALRLNKMIKDRHNTALSLLALGRAESHQTHYDAAARYEEQALQILRDLSDFTCWGSSLLFLGWNAFLAGDSDLAVSHLEECLSLYREKVDIQNGPALPLVSLGWIAVSQSDVSRAKVYFREALEFLKLREFPYWLARCLEGMCAIPQIQNKKAAKLFGKAEAIREQEVFVVPLSERHLMDPIPERLQSQLGEDVFDSARAAGGLLTYQQAVDEAMEVLQSIE